MNWSLLKECFCSVMKVVFTILGVVALFAVVIGVTVGYLALLEYFFGKTTLTAMLALGSWLIMIILMVTFAKYDTEKKRRGL